MKFLLPALCLLVTGCLGLPDLPALASGNTDMAPDDGSSADASSDGGPPADIGDAGDARDAGPPTPVWLQITAGENHACALHVDGDIYCWGRNFEEQLGLGDTALRYKPTKVTRPDRVTWDAVAAGNAHTCAVGETDAGGQAYCWGSNAFGEVSMDAAETDSPTLVTFDLTTPVFAVGDAARVGAGVAYSCALQSDGVVNCWGLPDDTRTGNGSGIVMNLPMHAIALGERFGCGLTNDDDSVACWGTLPPDIENSASAAKQEGMSLPAYQSLSVGGDHGCAVSDEGEVWCFGNNEFFGAGGAIVDKLGHADGGDHAIGKVPQLSGATAVAAGWNHTCAVSGTDSTVKCWGSNTLGETGQRDKDPGGSATLQTVPMLRGVTAIAAGKGFNCAIARGNIYCWGSNAWGQLGRGVEDAMPGMVNNVPMPVVFP